MATSSTIEIAAGEILSDPQQVLGKWREYCNGLYNHNVAEDDSVLKDLVDKATPNSPAPKIRISEVESAIKSLKNKKSAGRDNMPGELIKNGGEAVATALLDICNKILTKGDWPKEWTKSILIPIPKKSSQKCEDYSTVSLICHASKVMLKIIQRRIEKVIENARDDTEAGFRANRSTAEQICNLKVIGEKYIQHQMAVYCNFIDYKKAVNRV